jgi:DNA-binding CsgD family transcriptional regulator/PAS domain-containing protein
MPTAVEALAFEAGTKSPRLCPSEIRTGAAIAAREGQLAQILGDLYGGSGDPRDWTGLLDEICLYLGGGSARIAISGSARCCETAPGLVDEPVIVVGDDGMARLSALLVREEEVVATLTITRRREAFTGGDRERLAALLPHFRRAYQLRRTQRRAESMARSAAAFLDVLGNAVLLCDGQARLIFANEAARGLSAQGAILLRGERLGLPRSADEHRLVAAIAGAARDGHTTGLAVARPQPHPALRLVISRLPEGHAFAGFDPGAELVAVIAVGGEGLKPIGALLTSLFDLTAAEARLVDQLRLGQSLKEAADALGVAHSTTRTQLAAIFSKTQTSRQSELVGLVTRLSSLQGPF